MDAFLDKFARIPLIQKILGLLGICILISVVFYFAALSPQKSKQQNMKNSISTLENSLEEKKKMVGDLSQYKREVEKLNQDLQKALKLLPNRSEIPSLLQKVSSLAKKSGLDIIKFQPKPEIPQDFYAKVPVNLTLNGSYNEITNFFDAVGKLSRIVNISDFMFNLDKGSKKKGEKGGKKLLSATCVATTFRFIPAGQKKKKKKKGKK